MRDGVNPEKFKGEKNTAYLHRVIIPVYIPNIEESYYTESLSVLDYCLNSVIQTINPQTTAITLINNNSTILINKVLEKHLPYIDKKVTYNDNKGKVYAVLSEARASYEPFITIADADILFLSGWEHAVFEIFNNFSKAGVVAPLPTPNLAFSNNFSVFFNHYLTNKIFYNKVVSDDDCELYLKGLGNSAILNRNNRKYSWKEKQYFLKNNQVTAVLGSGHFIATYRKEIFNYNKSFPELKFFNGYEDAFIDIVADKLGWYRLSTVKTFAYHIGNKMDDFVRNITFDKNQLIKKEVIQKLKSPAKSKIPYKIKSIFFRVLRKIKKL